MLTMNAKEKAPTGAATPERAEETATLESTTIPESYPITCDSLIASILQKSGEHLTARQLASSIGVSDPRVITRQIQNERASAAPICASTGSVDHGYFWPKNLSELERYIRSLRRRHKAISATLDGLERARDSMAGQESLFQKEAEE